MSLLTRRRMMGVKSGGTTPETWDIDWNYQDGTPNSDISLGTSGNAVSRFENGIGLYMQANRNWYAYSFATPNVSVTDKCTMEVSFELVQYEIDGGFSITAKTNNGVAQFRVRKNGEIRVNGVSVAETASLGYHTVRIERNEDRNKFYFDGSLVYSADGHATTGNYCRNKTDIVSQGGSIAYVSSIRISVN